MDQKMLRLIAIILGVCCFLSLGFAFSYVAKYNSLETEYKKLENNNKALSQDVDNWTKKFSSAKDEINRLKERQMSIEAELDRASNSRDELQRKVDEITKQRDDLMQKLADLQVAINAKAQVQPQASVQPQEVHPVQPDEYWSGVLKDKADLEVQVANLKDMLKEAQIKADEQAALELELQKATKEKEHIQMSLAYNENSLDNLSMQLYKERESKRDLQKQLEIFKQENSEIRSRLKETLANKIALERKLKEVEGSRLELYNRLTQMDQLLQDKMSSLLETKQALSGVKKTTPAPEGSNIELSPIVVRSQQEETKGPPFIGSGPAANLPNNPITGRVININNENNFVIIDIGENQGIRKGMIFGVYSNQNQIATIEIIQTRTNVSAADIKEKASNIKVGDTVR